MANHFEMEFKHWSDTVEDLERHANIGRQLTLSKLLVDNKISKEDYEHYMRDFAVILAEPSMFSKLWDKLLKNPKGDRFILVQQISLSNDVMIENSVEKENKMKKE
jgi:hypothetical protein